MRQVLDRVHNFLLQSCRRKSAVTASRLVVPPGLRFRWQITGVRQHRFAQANPLVVEPLKSRRERGYFIHPELYGAWKTRVFGGIAARSSMPQLREAQKEQVAARAVPSPGIH